MISVFLYRRKREKIAHWFNLCKIWEWESWANDLLRCWWRPVMDISSQCPCKFTVTCWTELVPDDVWMNLIIDLREVQSSTCLPDSAWRWTKAQHTSFWLDVSSSIDRTGSGPEEKTLTIEPRLDNSITRVDPLAISMTYVQHCTGSLITRLPCNNLFLLQVWSFVRVHSRSVFLAFAFA